MRNGICVCVCVCVCMCVCGCVCMHVHGNVLCEKMFNCGLSSPDGLVQTQTPITMMGRVEPAPTDPT